MKHNMTNTADRIATVAQYLIETADREDVFRHGYSMGFIPCHELVLQARFPDLDPEETATARDLADDQLLKHVDYREQHGEWPARGVWL